MTIIHMETEEVQSTVDFINNRVSELRTYRTSLNRAKWSLLTTWISWKSLEFQADLGAVIRQFDEHVDTLGALNSRLNAEVEEWLHVDAWFWKKGMLDDKRDYLKGIFNDDTANKITAADAVSILIPSTFIGVLIEIGGGVNDFMDLSIEDWEQYDTFGEEVAATLFDLMFAAAKTGVLIKIEMADLFTDVFAFMGPGYLATVGAGALTFVLQEIVGAIFDGVYSLEDQLGMKDAAVEELGKLINDQMKAYDSTFNPYQNQIMTSPVIAN